MGEQNGSQGALGWLQLEFLGQYMCVAQNGGFQERWGQREIGSANLAKGRFYVVFPCFPQHNLKGTSGLPSLGHRQVRV